MPLPIRPLLLCCLLATPPPHCDRHRRPAVAGHGTHTQSQLLRRWAMAANKPKDFYAGEPQVPQWVLERAGVASE